MHLLRRIAAVAALAVPLAFATGASAQQTGTITGQVTDAADGRPLAGVQMVLAGTNLGTLTNANGRYIITRAPLGTQTVRAVLIGYSQANQQVNVTAGQPVVADFQLSTSAVNLEAIVVSAATGREQRPRHERLRHSRRPDRRRNPAGRERYDRYVPADPDSRRQLPVPLQRASDLR